MADVTDFADFEGFYQSTEEKKEACNRHDTYQRVIQQLLHEKHNPSINNFSLEKKESKVKVVKQLGKPLEQNKSKLSTINIHRLTKKEKLQLWELRDQYALDASHSFVDDHVLWLKKTLDRFKFCFPSYKKAKSLSYTEFVEIVQAEFSANTIMFLNLFNHSLTTDFLHNGLPRNTKKKFTKSRLEKLLMKSPLFFYDQSHEVWHPIFELQQKSNAPEMYPYVHWLGVLDIRKMWALKGSHTLGAKVRMECVKSVLNENSLMTLEEITEILCSYFEMPNCIEITSLIHQMLQTSRNFRRCEDQGLERVEESRYFKRAHTKSTTPVTAVIRSNDEKSKSFLTWASIVSKYAMKESYGSAKHPYCITLEAEKISAVEKSKGEGIVTKAVEEKQHKKFASNEAIKNSDLDQPQIDSVAYKGVPDVVSILDLVEICVSPGGVTTVRNESTKQPPFSFHYQNSKTGNTNNLLNKTQTVSTDAKGTQTTNSSKVIIEDTQCNVSTLDNAHPLQPYQAKALKTPRKPFSSICSQTLMNTRPPQIFKSCSVGTPTNTRSPQTCKSCSVDALMITRPPKIFESCSGGTLMSTRPQICEKFSVGTQVNTSPPQLCKSGSVGTLMNTRPLQTYESCSVVTLMNQGDSSLFKKDNFKNVPTGDSHPSLLKVFPNTSEARILNSVNPPFLGNLKSIEKNNDGSFSIPLNESNVEQKEEITATSLLANKDSSNINKRIDTLVSVSSANSENRQEATRNVTTVKKADLRDMQENTGMSTCPSVTDSRYLQGNTGKSVPVVVTYPSTVMENTGVFGNGKNISENTSISVPGVGSGTKAMLKNSDSSKKWENIDRTVPVMQEYAKNIPERTGISAHATLSDSNILKGINLYVPVTPEGSTINLKGTSLLSSDTVVDSRNAEKHYGTSAYVTVMDSRNVSKNHKLQLPANQGDSESLHTNPITSVHVSKVGCQNTQDIVDKSVSVTKRCSEYIQENSDMTASSTQRDAINSKKDMSLLVHETEGDSKVVQGKIGITISPTQEQRHSHENAGMSPPLLQKNSSITRKLPRVSVSVAESSIRNIHENARFSESLAQGDHVNTGVNADKNKSFDVAQENVKDMHENANIPLPVIKSDSRNIMENTNIPLSIALSATEKTKENCTVPRDHAYSRDSWEKTDACAHLTQEGSRCTEKNSSSCCSEDHTYSRYLESGAERFTSCNPADSSKSLHDSCSALLDTVASEKPKSECVSTRRRKLDLMFRMGCCNDTEHESENKRQKMHKKPFHPDAVDQYRLPLIMGWIREVVTRSISAKLEPEHDVYYHSPLGKKLRSSVELQKYLNTMKVKDITVDNFTYKKNLLGFGEPYEIARFAKARCAEDEAVTRPRRRGLCKNINCTSKVPISSYEEIPSSVFPDDGFWVTSFFDTSNDMGTDDVDIVNEAGEVTGYEEWINISPLNKNCVKPLKKTVNAESDYDEIFSRLQHCIDLVNEDPVNLSVSEKDTGSMISHMDLEDMDVDVEIISNCRNDTESHTTFISDFAKNEFEINPCKTLENQRSAQRHPELLLQQHAENCKAKISPCVNCARSAKLYVEPQPHFEIANEHCSLNLVPSIGSGRCGLDVSSTKSTNQRPDEKRMSVIPVQQNGLQGNATGHASGVSKSCEIMRQCRKNGGIRTINQRKMQRKKAGTKAHVNEASDIKSTLINHAHTVGDLQSNQKQDHSDNICKCFMGKDIPENSLAVSNISNKRKLVLCHNNVTPPVVTQIRNGSHTEEKLVHINEKNSCQNTMSCLTLERNGNNIENDKEFTGGNSEIKADMQPMKYYESGTESSFLLPNLDKDIVLQNQNDLDRANNDVSTANFSPIRKMNHMFITASNSDCQQISETNPSLSNGTVIFSDKYELYPAEKHEKKPINENLVTSEHVRFGLDNYSPEKGKKLLAYIMPTQNGFIVPTKECIAASPQQNVPSGNLMNCNHSPQVPLQYLQTYTPVSQQHCMQNNGHISTMSCEGINARLLQNTSNSLAHTSHKPTSQGCMDSVSLQNIGACSRCMDNKPLRNECHNMSHMPTSNGCMDTRLPQSMVVSNNCMKSRPQTVPSCNGCLHSAPHQGMAFSKSCMHSVGNSMHMITNCGCPYNVSLQNMTVCSGTSHTLPQNKAVSIAGTDTVTKNCFEVPNGHTNTIPQGNIAVSSDSMSNIPMPCITVSSTCMNSTPSQNTVPPNSHLYCNHVQKMCLPGGKVNFMPMQPTVVTNEICNPLQNVTVPSGSMDLTPQTVPVVNGSNYPVTRQSMGVTKRFVDSTRQCTHMASNYGYKDKISLQNVPDSCGVMHTLPQKNDLLSDNCTNSVPQNTCIPLKNSVSLLRIALSNEDVKHSPKKDNTLSNLQLHTNLVPKKSMADTSVSTVPAQNAGLSEVDSSGHHMKVARVSYKPLRIEQDSILPFESQCVPSGHGKTLCSENTTLRQQVLTGVHKRPLQTKQYKFYHDR